MLRQRFVLFLVLVFFPLTLAQAQVPIGGFIPFVGIGLTDEFKDAGSDLTGTFFISDPEFSQVGSPLTGNTSPFHDIALLDTGAATHILTAEASGANGFNINGNGFEGLYTQQVGGATGIINLDINDPLGIFAAGMGDRTADGSSLEMDTSAFRGQSSFATLSAPSSWTLPNILGLPMAAHHAIHIKNSEPQIFELDQRTVRTPQVDFIDLGTGYEQNILRRTDLKIRPGASFIAGPIYVQNLDILGGNFDFHDNPLSPTIIENGAMFIDVDLRNGADSLEDKELLFDTGADLTVVSQLTAARLGFDPILDTPDFVLEVEGSGGVSSGVPGFYLEELNIDTVGGSFTVYDVPIAVLDVTNPNDPGNTIDGIIGMHLFNGRDLVIDANASIGQGGAGPSLYISDPVTDMQTWTSTASQTNWSTANNWSSPGVPDQMWDTRLINSAVANQTVSVSSDSTVFRLTIGATAGNNVELQIQDNTTLTTFGEVTIEAGGEILLLGSGSRLDVQFINIEGGVLKGEGIVFTGTGPITTAVRNLSGTIRPGDGTSGEMIIEGDLANAGDGTLLFNLDGTIAVTEYAQIDVERFAFLGGTLEVTLGSFVPTAGDSFTLITAGEGVEGQFDEMILPEQYLWDIDYFSNSVVLEMLGLAGDFNGDGSVLGDDLAVWQAGYGTLYDLDDFLMWQRNYQNGVVQTASAVPEPGSCMLILLGLAGIRAFIK